MKHKHLQNAEILRYFQPLCLSEISQARMKLKKLKIVNGQNHFANRNHKECKQCILHSMRRFADMISAVAEWKVPILMCKCGEIRCHFRPLHCSIWRNRNAFSTVYLLEAAKSNGVSDLCFLQCGELVMKNGEGGVQITVFAAGKLGNVIAMRAFRRVFRLFSCLFDD